MTELTSRIIGRLAYRNGLGEEVGRETFEILGHPKGYSFRAWSEMDDIHLFRDATMTFDPDWKPLDGFVRVTVGCETKASVWIGFDGDDAVLEGQVRTGNMLELVSDRIERTERPAYLGLHPLQGDALIVNCLPDGTRPGEIVQIDTITNSHSPDGDQDIALRSISIGVTFIGNETIDVAAGRFAARRFAVSWGKDWPAADLWVRAEDCVLLRLRWSLIERWYELTALKES